MPQFKTIFARLFRESGLTVTELADRTNLNRQAIYKLLNGESERPTWETVCKLAAAMGVSTEEFRTRLQT